MTSITGSVRPRVVFDDPLEEAIITVGTIQPINVTLHDDDSAGYLLGAEFLWSHTGLFGDAVPLGTVAPTVITGKVTSVANELAMRALGGVVIGDAVSREDLDGVYFFCWQLPSDQAASWKRVTGGTAASVSWDTAAVTVGKPGKLFARAYDATGWGDYSERIVTLNHAPSGVTILTPTEGQRININTPIAMTWTAATDPDTPSSEIRYLIEFSKNGGGTWEYVPGVPFTDKGVTSYSFDALPHIPMTDLRLRVTAFDGYTYGPPADVGVSFLPIVTSISAVPSALVEIGDEVALTAEVDDPDSTPDSIYVEYLWSPTGTLGGAGDSVIGNSALDEPFPLTWDTTLFFAGEEGRIFARAVDDIGAGPWASILFNLGTPHENGDCTLIWLDPDTDEMWAQERFRWYNPEYDPWSKLQHGFEEFGTLTKIRQPVEVNARFAILDGSGDGIPDKVLKRIIARRGGFDTSHPWHKAKVLFTDLFSMTWEVKILTFVPLWTMGHELSGWRFEFGVVQVPDEIKTPVGEDL